MKVDMPLKKEIEPNQSQIDPKRIVQTEFQVDKK